MGRRITRWLRPAAIGAALIVAIAGVIALLDPVLGPGVERWIVLVTFLVFSVAVGLLVRRSSQLADEQAAWGRVATLVAQGVAPSEVFATVAREVGLLLRVDAMHMARYEPDGTATGVAAWSASGDAVPVGLRVGLEGESVVAQVKRTGQPARMRGYEHATGPGAALGRQLGLRSSVGAPIVVDQRVWGVMVASSKRDASLPAKTESRIAAFAELSATAIANAESRADLVPLVEEQAALRRIATLVASGPRPEVVFAAVCEVVGQLLGADVTSMGRYDPDGGITYVEAWGQGREHIPVGLRQTLGGNNAGTRVFETGQSVRIDSYPDLSTGRIGDAARAMGVNSSLASPIIVEGRLWGMMAAGALNPRRLPADSEARLTSFTELVGTAIANAENRTALEASRARLVAAADEARRRIERDLHDGIQQRLVTLGLEVRAALATSPPETSELELALARAADGIAIVFDELREIARGIHPAILSSGGLTPALKALARRSTVPVELELHVDRRLPERVEVCTYYVVSEVLTNASKHAHATVVNVVIDADPGALHLTIRDDGVGGADPARGSGLTGLRDRVEAIGGLLHVTSRHGEGTEVAAELPLVVEDGYHPTPDHIEPIEPIAPIEPAH